MNYDWYVGYVAGIEECFELVRGQADSATSAMLLSSILERLAKDLGLSNAARKKVGLEEQ